MNLSILSLNCWLFPRPISSDINKRISGITELIEKNDPDVVVLQEVWSKKALWELKQSLPQYHFVSTRTPFYNQGGLATLLKFPPAHSRMHFFKLSRMHNFTELLLHKGYLLTEIHVQGRRLAIINAHLYAPLSKESEMIVREQLQEIVKSAPKENAFLCGDLNMAEETVNKICGANFYRLCNSQNTRDSVNPYCYKRFNALMPSVSSKIDYVLCSNPKPVETKMRLIESPLVSDHYPLLVSLRL